MREEGVYGARGRWNTAEDGRREDARSSNARVVVGWSVGWLMPYLFPARTREDLVSSLKRRIIRRATNLVLLLRVR